MAENNSKVYLLGNKVVYISPADSTTYTENYTDIMIYTDNSMNNTIGISFKLPNGRFTRKYNTIPLLQKETVSGVQGVPNGEYYVRVLPMSVEILKQFSATRAQGLDFSINITRCLEWRLEQNTINHFIGDTFNSLSQINYGMGESPSDFIQNGIVSCNKNYKFNTEIRSLDILPAFTGEFDEIVVDYAAVHAELELLYNRLDEVYNDYGNVVNNINDLIFEQGTQNNRLDSIELEIGNQGLVDIDLQNQIGVDKTRITKNENDIAGLESNKLNRSGTQPMTGNLNMGGFRINNNPDLTDLVTKQTNLQNNKVDKTLTIMDLDLQNNITRTEVVNAIGEATQILSGLMSTTDKARLDALHALLGTQPDADSVVNTINEVLAIFNTYPEGANLLDTLNGKVDKIAGKQLSTNDLTDVLKNHYDVAYTHSQQTDNNPHATKFADLFSKPSTIAGFGITDAFTKVEVNSLIEGLKASHNLEQNDLTPTPLANNGTLPILTIDGYDMIVVMVTVDGQSDSKVFVPNNIQENETFKAVIQTTPTVNMTITKGALNYTFNVDGGTSIDFKVDGWKVTQLVASDVITNYTDTNYLNAETTQDNANRKFDSELKSTNDRVRLLEDIQSLSEVYGIKWTKSSNDVERVYNSIGKSYTKLVADNITTIVSGFDDIPLFANQRRCNLNMATGEVVAYYGDTGYTETPPVGIEVMVERPRFYFKIERTANTITWLVSPVQKAGFEIYPAFVRNGVIKDNIYISAYEGAIYDNLNGLYIGGTNIIPNITDGLLRSIKGQQPSSNHTIVENRTMALANNGEGYDALSHWALSMLMIIEYATLNTQEVFRGVVDYSAGTGNHAQNTGHTSVLGNQSGEVDVPAENGATGQIFQKVFSYRGAENLHGNIWKWLYGMNFSPTGDIGGVYIADHNFVSNKFDEQYTRIGQYPADTANGYMDDIIDYAGFVPSSTTGSSITSFSDYIYKSTATNRVALVGGTWANSSSAGAFALSLGSSSGGRDRGVGARLLRF